MNDDAYDEMYAMLGRTVSEISGVLTLLYTDHAFEAGDPLFELMHDIVVMQKRLREHRTPSNPGDKQ